MKQTTLYLFITVLLAGLTLPEESGILYQIPEQTIDLYKVTGQRSKSLTLTVSSFEISELVSFREYKTYLSAVQSDSSKSFYLSQLPDANIGTCDIRQKYISDPVYEDFPVLGISWDNAMHFCKWKTLRENGENIRFIYRLPNCSEWLAAYSILTEQKKEHDFNKKYSDWLINPYEESLVFLPKGGTEAWPYDWLYFHDPADPPTLKRKQVIGNSFLYQQQQVLPYPFSFYADEGYRQVGFRYVKEWVAQSSESDYYPTGNEKQILTFWGLAEI